MDKTYHGPVLAPFSVQLLQLFLGIPEFLDSRPKSWTLEARLWTLGIGGWTLDVKTLRF